MPNYSYKCTQCDATFMKSMKVGSKELPACPKCHGRTQKIITAPSMIFKGSGFYKTDTKITTPKTEAAKTTPAPDNSKPNTDIKTNTNAPSHDSAA